MKKKKKKKAWRRLVITLPLLPTQAATPLPRLTPSSHGALSPPNTSARASDWYTWVIVCQNGEGGYQLIGKSGACQEICCRELPSAPDAPSNCQSRLKKKKEKKTPVLNSLEHQVSARHEPVPKVPASAVTAETTFLDSSNDIVLLSIFCWHLNQLYLSLFYI